MQGHLCRKYSNWETKSVVAIETGTCYSNVVFSTCLTEHDNYDEIEYIMTLYKLAFEKQSKSAFGGFEIGCSWFDPYQGRSLAKINV